MQTRRIADDNGSLLIYDEIQKIMSEYHVLIICPYRLIREGLGLMLADEEELEVVGATRDVDEALDLITLTQRDPGRRVLVTVDCRRRHRLERSLRIEPELDLVNYQAL